MIINKKSRKNVLKLKIDILKLRKDLKEIVNFKLLNFRSLTVFLLVIAAFLLGILFNKITSINGKEFSLNKQTSTQENNKQQSINQKGLTKIQSEVIKDKYVFKIKWTDLGKKMVEDGIIDKTKLAQAIAGKDELPKDLEKYFSGNQNQIELTQSNSQFWVDVLWGLGLANKNKILEEGDMMTDGDASNFASTGGWTLGVSDAMNYYSKYSYINLTETQQKAVEEIAGNIYRPCCGNSTAFPDCNHGMAALGLIELMVSQNFSKEDIYKTVLAFNTYWFPQTYLDTAYYFKQNGRDYKRVSPKELLSKTFSSAMGAEAVQKKIGTLQWPALKGGGSCGA